MKGVSAADMIEGNIGLVGVNAFMGLIDNEDIPFRLGDFIKFTVLPVELYRPLQILEADELDASHLRMDLDIILIRLP